MESPVERYLRYAEQLVLKGTRPTLDLLVAQLGGSRTTAQKALTDFWAERLPKMLAAREYETDVPVAVREAIGTLWRAAVTDADERAQADLAATREELDNRRAALDAAMAEIAAERASFAEIRRAQQERITGLEAQLGTTRSQLEIAEQSGRRQETELVQVRAQLDAARARHELDAAEIERLKADGREALARHDAERARLEVAAAETVERVRADALAAREAAERSHAAAMSDLKEGYHRSEQDLRVRLDAAETAAKNAEAERARARGELQEVRGVLREVREQLELAKAEKPRVPWRRPTLRRPSITPRR